MTGVAIIGCGLIGGKRAQALAGARLVACADVLPDRARALAQTVSGASACDDWNTAVRDSAVGIVIVATTNDALAPVTLAALEAGKHVLVEKPAARSVEEIERLIAAEQASGGADGVGVFPDAAASGGGWRARGHADCRNRGRC